MPDCPDRIKSWRDRGYRVHLMTGVSWGEYQDYLYGRFDGVNHEDEAQTDRNGKVIGHGGDVYYMCPARTTASSSASASSARWTPEPRRSIWRSRSSGCAAAIRKAFKREWKAYYHEDWQRAATPRPTPSSAPRS